MTCPINPIVFSCQGQTKESWTGVIRRDGANSTTVLHLDSIPPHFHLSRPGRTENWTQNIKMKRAHSTSVLQWDSIPPKWFIIFVKQVLGQGELRTEPRTLRWKNLFSHRAALTLFVMIFHSGSSCSKFQCFIFSDQLKGHLMKSKSSSPDFGQSH